MTLLLVRLALAQDPASAAPAEVEGSVVPEPAPRFDPTAWTGKLVAQVSLSAPNGGLPEESLEPLLRTRADQPYSPAQVRQDVVTLYRIGDFSQVEAEAEPWIVYGPDGAPQEGVLVSFRVYAPPRVGDLDIHGNHGLPRHEILAAMGVDTGATWRDDSAAAAEVAIRTAYLAAGYPAATAKVTPVEPETGRVDLDVEIDEGQPRTVVTIVAPPQKVLADAQVTALLRRGGIREGKPLREASLETARDLLLKALRDRGYYEATVTLKPADTSAGTRLLVLVDPRRKWRIVLDGKHDNFLVDGGVVPPVPDGLPKKASVREILDLDSGVRLTRYVAEDAGRSINEHEVARGFVDSEITVDLVEDPGEVVLTLRGGRGRMHVRDHHLEVSGESQYPESFLRAALRDGLPEELRRGPFLLGLGPYRVSPDGIDKAAGELADFYRAQGYADVVVRRVSYTPLAPRPAFVPVKVGLQVEAGPLVRVRSVRIDGGLDGMEVGDLFSSLVDQPFNPSSVADRSRELVNLYREAGYLGADASPGFTRASPDQVDLVVKLDPGPPVYLRGILVKGYRRTRRSVLEREIDLQPGDLVRPSAISDVRKGLYDLSVFDRVSVETVGDEDRVKDLVVTVNEAPNLFFEVGGGVASDEGIKLTLRGGHRNLFGLAHRLTGYGQIGLGWVGDSFGIDTAALEWQAGMRYEAPHIPGRDEKVALDVLFNAQDQEPAWRIERTGGGPSVRLKVGKRGTAEIGYSLQWRRLQDLDPGLLVAGDPWLEELGVSDLSDPRPILPSASRIHSGLDLSLVLDFRNDTFNPTAGGIGTFNAGVTDGVLADVLFLKGETSWTHFLTLSPLSFLLRGRVGGAWVPGDEQALPIEDRFQLGGTSFRGFLPSAIGPANEVSPEYVDFPGGIGPVIDYTSRGATNRWVPTGGDAMAAGTVEMQVPFPVFGLKDWPTWRLAVFSDFGNVWWVSPLVKTDSMTTKEDPLLRYGLGLGLRKSTPIGPIALDLGFNPSALDYRDEGLFHLHLSLGSL